MPEFQTLDSIRLTTEGRDYLRHLLGAPVAPKSDSDIVARMDEARRMYGQEAENNAGAVLQSLPDEPSALQNYARRMKIIA